MEGVPYIRFRNWCVNMIGVVNVKDKLHGIPRDLVEMCIEIKLYISISTPLTIYMKYQCNQFQLSIYLNRYRPIHPFFIYVIIKHVS